jgi:hypothetical protein
MLLSVSAETIFVSIVTGIGTGVAASFLVWWWLARRIRASIAICPTLATFISSDGGRRTQFRVWNAGSRDAYEVSIRVSLRLPGLIAPGVIEWTSIRQCFVSALPAGKSRRWSIRPEKSEDLRGYLKHLPASLRVALEAGDSIDLADVFSALPHATLRIAVFATDSYSGTRSYREATFVARDVVSGRFLGERCEHAPTEDWMRGDPLRRPGTQREEVAADYLPRAEEGNED